MFKLTVLFLIAPLAIAQQPHKLGKFVPPHFTPVSLGTYREIPSAPRPVVVKIVDSTHIRVKHSK